MALIPGDQDLKVGVDGNRNAVIHGQPMLDILEGFESQPIDFFVLLAIQSDEIFLSGAE